MRRSNILLTLMLSAIINAAPLSHTNYPEVRTKNPPATIYKSNSDGSFLNKEEKCASIETVIEEETENIFPSSNYKFIKDFLSQPFKGFGSNGIDRFFGVISLSNIAEGLAKLALTKPKNKKEIITLLDNAVKIALDRRVSPYSRSPEGMDELGNHGLYLAHLNIILGAYQLAAGDNKYFKLNKKISEYLARKSLEDPQKHMHSYNNLKYKWPADQTALLFSLWFFDKNYGKNISKEPIKEWLAYMEEKAMDKKTGLHYSEVTGISYGKIPRGCAISYSVYYMSFFAPEEARKLWENYKKHYKQDYILFAGFREWPNGVSRRLDYDYGPIILGNGTAATGLALRAAIAVGDRTTYFQLRNTVGSILGVGRICAKITKNEKLEKVVNNILIRSIIFNSERYVKNFGQ